MSEEIKKRIEHFANLCMTAGTANSGLVIDVFAGEKHREMREAGKALEEYLESYVQAKIAEAEAKEHRRCRADEVEPLKKALADMVNQLGKRVVSELEAFACQHAIETLAAIEKLKEGLT